MTNKEQEMEKQIEKAIDILYPLIEENGVGNVLMALSGMCSANSMEIAKHAADDAAAYKKASELLTPVAKLIQLLAI